MMNAMVVVVVLMIKVIITTDFLIFKLKSNLPFFVSRHLQDKLHQRANEGRPVFEDYRCIRNPGDMSTVETSEEEKCLKDLVIYLHIQPLVTLRCVFVLLTVKVT